MHENLLQYNQYNSQLAFNCSKLTIKHQKQRHVTVGCGATYISNPNDHLSNLKPIMLCSFVDGKKLRKISFR